MTALARTLRDVVGALAGGVPFALVGGLAVSVRTEPRFTRDIDLAIAVVDDTEAEPLVHRLLGIGFTTEAVLENTRTQRLATMRLRRTSRSPVVDLLFASCGIEPEIVREATPMTVLAQELAVARTGHLIAMKLLARDDKRRPQDAIDLRALSLEAGPSDWTLAAEAVTTIAARGFARGRDLARLLAELRESLA